MAGRGTGYPISFLCTVERRERGHAGIHKWERTGRTKPASSPTKGHPRKLRTSWEYLCSCGHRGWTSHKDILAAPIRPLDAVRCVGGNDAGPVRDRE